MIEMFSHNQFIYELQLAQLELQALDVDFKHSADNIYKFVSSCIDDCLRVKKRAGYFQTAMCMPTDYSQIIQKQKVIKSYSQYLTHWIYPYKGKFHPQMARSLLNILKLNPNDTVLDPFIGSGTTALEAKLLGINCIGFDVSPLCVFVSKVKTMDYDEQLQQIDFMSYFNKLFLNPVDKVEEFITVANLLAVSHKVKRKQDILNAYKKYTPLILESLHDVACTLKELNIPVSKIDIQLGDARRLPLPSESVDGVITSPPYTSAIDYIANDKHAYEALQYDTQDLKSKIIGVDLENYKQDMAQVYREIYRVLKPNKMIVIIIGNSQSKRSKHIDAIQFTREFFVKNLNCELLHDIKKVIFGLYNTILFEYILIFKK